MGVRLIELAMKHSKIRHTDPETGKSEMIPFCEHLLMSTNKVGKRFELVGTLRIQDEIVIELLKLSNVRIY